MQNHIDLIFYLVTVNNYNNKNEKKKYLLAWFYIQFHHFMRTLFEVQTKDNTHKMSEIVTAIYLLFYLSLLQGGQLTVMQNMFT